LILALVVALLAPLGAQSRVASDITARIRQEEKTRSEIPQREGRRRVGGEDDDGLGI
jgi:hypothetical protein